jgi:hypothetical protein
METFVAQKAGSGPTFKAPKMPRGRIERLGKMNDRHTFLLGARDFAGLLELAAEYEAMNMPRMAAQIRKEVPNAAK